LGLVEEVLSMELSRRDGARGLLFTVLGEFVLPAGGVAWTSAFIEVFGRLGIEEKAARQALARTAADGWIAPCRDGRRTSWALTEDGRRLLIEGTARIYSFTGSQQDWDGRWLLVLARLPESARPGRHLLRTRLSWAGLGSPSPGVWLSPHVTRRDEVMSVLADAGVTDGQIFVATHDGSGSLASLVRAAWDLAAIEARYEAFLASFAAESAADPLVKVTELVHAWRRFPSVDPGLPRELLPERWSGERAAEQFGDRHARWSPGAAGAWALLNE
jgi:phenylacetic acid degradation operon negative regulatory protein